MKSLQNYINDSLVSEAAEDLLKGKNGVNAAKKWIEFSKKNYKGDNQKALNHFNQCLMDFFSDPDNMQDISDAEEGYALEDFFFSDCWDNWMEDFEPDEYEDFKQLFDKNAKKIFKL